MNSKLLRGFGKENGQVVDSSSLWNAEISAVASDRPSGGERKGLIPSTFLTKKGNLVLFTHPDEYTVQQETSKHEGPTAVTRGVTTLGDLFNSANHISEPTRENQQRYKELRSQPGRELTGYLGQLRYNLEYDPSVKALMGVLGADYSRGGRAGDGSLGGDFDLRAFLQGQGHGPLPPLLSALYQEVRAEEARKLAAESAAAAAAAAAASASGNAGAAASSSTKLSQRDIAQRRYQYLHPPTAGGAAGSRQNRRWEAGLFDSDGADENFRMEATGCLPPGFAASSQAAGMRQQSLLLGNEESEKMQQQFYYSSPS